jgi:flagellar biosynthesis/type III secretory pathway chaperone
MPARDPAAGLLALLADERRALLSGDLAALPDLVAAKERLVPLIEAGTGEGAATDPARLSRLREAALANQDLLEAALRGVRAAQTRLAAARGNGPALSTYDARGAAAPLGADRPAVERRA